LAGSSSPSQHRRTPQSGGDFLLLIPNHSRGSFELKPSDIQTRLPPGVFPGAPYRPPSAPHNISDLSAMLHGIPVLSTQALYPIPRPAWVFRRLIATNARLSKRFISRVSGQKNVSRYSLQLGFPSAAAATVATTRVGEN